MKLERLMELAGQPVILNELNNIEVTYNKDNIQSLKSKLEKAGVDISNMSDEAVLKFANKMDEITIESLKSDGYISEMIDSKDYNEKYKKLDDFKKFINSKETKKYCEMLDKDYDVKSMEYLNKTVDALKMLCNEVKKAM